MRNILSIKDLQKKYEMSENEIYDLIFECFGYFLSDDELDDFLLEKVMKKEEKINKRLQGYDNVTTFEF